MDHQVIGMDHALGKELPLDETEQVCHGRRTLDDHRARLVRGVGEDDVDAVETGERRVLRQGVQAPCGDILDDVGEETRHRWLGKLLGHPPGLALENPPGLLHVELLNVMAVRVLERRNAFTKLGHALAERRDLCVDPFRLGIIDGTLRAQRAEALWRDRRPVYHRQESRLHRATSLDRDQGQMVGPQLLLQGLANLSDLVLEAVVEGILLRAERVRREEWHQVVLDEGDEFVDAATQGGPMAAGDGQESRAVGLDKIVDVTAVVDQRTGRTDVIEELADQGEPPSAWQTADKDVLTRTRHLEPEA